MFASADDGRGNDAQPQIQNPPITKICLVIVAALSDSYGLISSRARCQTAQSFREHSRVDEPHDFVGRGAELRVRKRHETPGAAKDRWDTMLQ